MSSNIFSIGKSGLLAAQVGLTTTGQNIANANVPGYSRQVAIQTTAPSQQMGFGFIGSGTEVAQIKRYADNFIATQVNSAQSATSSAQAYTAQISQVDNMLADTTAGLSPALQDFFNGVQDLSANPASAAARQAMLSAGDSMAARFQSLSARLTEISDGINTQVTSNVTLINSYAEQIAQLNGSISSLGAAGSGANDMLDQRDFLVAELSKQIKVSTVAGDNNTITVSIGTGQPLVVGNQAHELATMVAPTDASRVQIGYVAAGKVIPLPDSAFSGGELGGLFEVRSALDQAQNSLGRIAISMAVSINAQHAQGIDQNGNQGGVFFSVAPALVSANANNSGAAQVTAAVSDATQLTTSDYKLKFDATNSQYVVTRQSDNQVSTIPYVAGSPSTATIDGVDYAISGAPVADDNFVVRPTINGASGFKLALTETAQIAAGVATVATTGSTAGNTGSATISAASVSANTSPLSAPVTLTYNSADLSLSGFPSFPVTVTPSDGSPATVYADNTAPILYSDGATISFNGISLSVSGAPADTDTFTVVPNTSAGDNRNVLLLGSLQTKNILNGGTATYQSAYSQLVSSVGNATRESQVSGLSSATLLAQTQTAQQNISGVNLDEEAANLLKYQQAYQAAGKIMQIASQMFDTLLNLGG